ncbi:MAG TPA: response regulator [Thermodesulfovibrionales bacterium]|nr:response regulator [Thermodesulfovibrionales bacterium]
MKKTKILIVEDESITAMNLQHILKHWGYETCEYVTSGTLAIEKAECEKPDIIILDVSLNSEINGIETARQIRSRFYTPVIFITGYSDKETMKQIEDTEPAGCFIKPLDFDKLKITLDSIAHKSRKKLGA